MKKTAVRGLTAAAVAAAVGAIVLPATAGAADSACRAGTDTVEVPYAYAADGTPLLAGIVCVRAGGTAYDSMTVSPGWRAELKSDGSKGRTEVRFTDQAGNRVDLRYEPGRTEIKR